MSPALGIAMSGNLPNELEQLKQDNGLLRETIEQLKAQVTDLEKRKSWDEQLKQQVQILQQENETLKAQVITQPVTVPSAWDDAMAKKVEQLQQENDQLAKVNNALTEQLKQQQELITRMGWR